MHRPLLWQVILDMLRALRAALERAEDDWSRVPAAIDRDEWWPCSELITRDRRRGARPSQTGGVIARLRRRRNDEGGGAEGITPDPTLP